MFKHITKIAFIACTTLAVCVTQSYAAGIEDPLRPPGVGPGQLSGAARGSSEPAWEVNEILFSGGRRVAIVNDVLVAIGDRINGARVLDIKPEHVVLEYKSGVINARLNAVSVKKIRNTIIN